MELAVDSMIVCVDQLERVAAVTVHKPIAVWCAAVREQERHLVSGLWTQADKIPEHVRVLQVCLRVSLLGVNEAGKLRTKLHECRARQILSVTNL